MKINYPFLSKEKQPCTMMEVGGATSSMMKVRGATNSNSRNYIIFMVIDKRLYIS